MAVEFAREAGDLTLRWFRDENTATEWKPDGSPVTAADRAAEQRIVDRLAERRPTDSIIGEELGRQGGSGPVWWCIDPIDGTKAFVRGVPLYTTLVGVGDVTGPMIGVIHSPATGETMWAGRGHGCWLNGIRTRVTSTARLGDAYVATSEPESWPSDVLQRLLTTGIRLRTWADGYGFLLVASGRMDAMVDPGGMKVWDMAPHPVIVTEAGGACTNCDGGMSLDSGSLVASNGSVHSDLLAVLAARPD